MQKLDIGPDTLLNVRLILGRDRTLTHSPSRVQLLVETRPNAGTRRTTEPVDLRLVIDVSGSMSDKVDHEGTTKLDVVKQAASALVRELGPRDQITIVVFTTRARTVIPSSVVTEEMRELILKKIDELRPEDSTTISDGLELGLLPTIDDQQLTRVILFTDGQSSNPEQDHPRLLELTNQARTANVPLSIYGTGSDYNWSLLQQLAVNAGHGSFLKHVMDLKVLEGHLLGELTELRGTAVDRLVFLGATPTNVTIVRVVAMMPLIHELDLTSRHNFQDATGALDIHRGAQFLIEVEITNPIAGEVEILGLTFSGRSRRTRLPFTVNLPVHATFVSDMPSQSPVHPDVRRVMLMIEGARQAERANYKEASEFYRRAGDNATATAMDTMATLRRQGADPEDVRRHASMVSGTSVTDLFTHGNLNPKRGS